MTSNVKMSEKDFFCRENLVNVHQHFPSKEVQMDEKAISNWSKLEPSAKLLSKSRPDDENVQQNSFERGFRCEFSADENRKIPRNACSFSSFFHDSNIKIDQNSEANCERHHSSRKSVHSLNDYKIATVMIHNENMKIESQHFFVKKDRNSSAIEPKLGGDLSSLEQKNSEHRKQNKTEKNSIEEDRRHRYIRRDRDRSFEPSITALEVENKEETNAVDAIILKAERSKERESVDKGKGKRRICRVISVKDKDFLRLSRHNTSNDEAKGTSSPISISTQATEAVSVDFTSRLGHENTSELRNESTVNNSNDLSADSFSRNSRNTSRVERSRSVTRTSENRVKVEVRLCIGRDSSAAVETETEISAYETNGFALDTKNEQNHVESLFDSFEKKNCHADSNADISNNSEVDWNAGIGSLAEQKVLKDENNAEGFPLGARINNASDLETVEMTPDGHHYGNQVTHSLTNSQTAVDSGIENSEDLVEEKLKRTRLRRRAATVPGLNSELSEILQNHRSTESFFTSEGEDDLTKSEESLENIKLLYEKRLGLTMESPTKDESKRKLWRQHSAFCGLQPRLWKLPQFRSFSSNKQIFTSDRCLLKQLSDDIRDILISDAQQRRISLDETSRTGEKLLEEKQGCQKDKASKVQGEGGLNCLNQFKCDELPGSRSSGKMTNTGNSIPPFDYTRSANTYSPVTESEPTFEPNTSDIMHQEGNKAIESTTSEDMLTKALEKMIMIAASEEFLKQVDLMEREDYEAVRRRQRKDGKEFHPRRSIHEKVFSTSEQQQPPHSEMEDKQEDGCKMSTPEISIEI